jgi:hypothetical protein
MKNLTTILVIFAFGFASILHAEEASKGKDKKYSKLIVGVWNSDITIETVSIKGVNTYKKDGIFLFKAKLKAGTQEIAIDIEGTWKVEKEFLITKVPKTNVPALLKVGEIIKDQILELNESLYKYKDEDGLIVTDIRSKK